MAPRTSDKTTTPEAAELGKSGSTGERLAVAVLYGMGGLTVLLALIGLAGRSAA